MASGDKRLSYEMRIFIGALFVALPALAACAVLAIGFVDAKAWHIGMGLVAVIAITIVAAWIMRRRAMFPLYTVSNLLEALREGDYSLRGSRARRGDAVGEVVWELNALAQTLREQRLAAEEKSALLTKVVATLDIAVLAFDPEQRLRLANPAAERLLSAGVGDLLGRSADALGIGELLGNPNIALVERDFPGGSGRWEIRHAPFRERGRAHDLVVITDLSRALREEERIAWQRLLRVLGHELNNSLAPIRSMAATVAKLIAHDPQPEDWRDDARSGLVIIGDRAESLARFMARYTALARLPPPSIRRVDAARIVRTAAALEQRVAVNIDPGADVQIDIDPDQIEQALINLIQNAADATLHTGGEVTLRWWVANDAMLIEIVDAGSGLPRSENLFVPFFTTKPGGSGIGLVLARQIVEQHGGSLTLNDRDDASGCIARVSLPVASATDT